MRRALAFAVAAGWALVLSATATAASADVKIAPVTRLPFPERGYVVSVPVAVSLDARNVRVRENGLRVAGARVDPLGSSGLRFGVVLALDASESMTGAPAAAALASARAFVAQRDDKQNVAILAFNERIALLRGLTQDSGALRRALEVPPKLAYGTRINDALVSSLNLLREARIASGSIVLLSDGADIGSDRSLDHAVGLAQKQQVRIFTVGLRSGAFDPQPLRTIAERTGGAYIEARSTTELSSIYAALGEQLAGEYLVRYRSAARPMSQVDVTIEIGGTGTAATTYVAPTPSLLEPYHRSLVTRFLLSSGSPLVISLLFGLLVCSLLLVLSRRPKSTVVDRVNRFASGGSRSHAQRAPASALKAATRATYTSGWWARLERDLEIARMNVTPRQVVGISLAGTVVIMFVGLLASAPLLALFGFTTPLVAKAIVRRKLKAIRDEFAIQFPASLQVLASALRAGHSFNGALEVVVQNAHEPARSEMARVVQDDRLGVLPEDAIRRMARRMANRDIEQVALLAELQRTAGGNSAEILDTVVSTIRERAEIRGLVRTLTAQGRMARWILTALPIFLAGFLWVANPDMTKAFFASSVGQVMLALAAAMVVSGSLIIQRIVDIDV